MSAPLLLLVDDAPEMALIVGRLAVRAGCTLEHRPDAMSALELLQERLPQLLLLDVNLPGMSGPELCRRVRANPATAVLNVAVFTHEGLDEDIAAGLEAGADFFFSKDLVLSPEGWERRVQEILATVRGQRPAALLRSRSDEVPFPVARDWVGVLNGAVRPPVLRGFGPPVVRVLLRRALSQVFAPSDSERCLTPDGCALDPERTPPVDGRVVAELAAALVERVWCLTGSATAVPVRAALAPVWPEPKEPKTP
jgi:CheY-like chemotaxis protein